MPCPNCGSHDLWDDNLTWGCNRCHWVSINGRVRNVAHWRDTINGEENWPGKPPNDESAERQSVPPRHDL